MVNWKRPENVPFPSVWRTFERKLADGTIRKYWIQDLTPEYEDIFLSKMVTVFLKDEPLCKHSNFNEDPTAVEKFKDLWRQGITQKLPLICLTKDENGTVQYVGGNLTCLSEKGEHFDLEGESKPYKKVMEFIGYVMHLKDIYEELQVNEYLTAYGLYVLHDYRGQGIGTEILKARRELCSAVGIKATATVFTAPASQKNAKYAGFKDFVEVNYDDLEKINPEWSFPGITSAAKSSKYMYIKYV